MKRLGLTQQILIALLVGLLVGAFFPALALRVKFLSDLFLRLVQMIIVPLLLGVLVSGLSSGGDFKKVGRIALLGLLFFAVLTLVVFVLGAALGLILQPGATAAVQPVAGQAESLTTAPKLTFAEVLTSIVPASAVDAMARNDMLQLIIFSLFLGVALSRVGAAGESLSRLFSELARVMFVVTDFVMRLAPVGVFAALAYAIAREGFQVLMTLLRLVLTVYLALLIMVFVFVAIALIYRISFLGFLRAAATPFLLAFSTSSTMPALPRALENMQKFGVPKEVVSFILPLGLRFNAVGSSLYQIIAVFFLIQYYRFPLTTGGVFMLLLVLTVMSKGLAPVPRASLIVITAALSSFNLPLEGISLILAVDQFMDMPRTGVNLLGNCLVSAAVGRLMTRKQQCKPG